jgi:hypothetical protein
MPHGGFELALLKLLAALLPLFRHLCRVGGAAVREVYGSLP